MKYALLIYDRPETYEQMTPEEYAPVHAEYLAISEAPECVGGAQLQPAHAATTVRVENGTMLTTDGPFADTKEILGGFYMIEAADLDAALEIAARIPAARLGGKIEVRPVVERQG